MKKTYTIICRVVTVLLITNTVACAPLIGTHGNLVDLQTVKKIQPDLQSKTDVVTLLGEPSTTSTFDPNIWFYIGQRTETIAFFKPEITEQRVLALSFDPQNKVEAVVLRGLSDYRDIEPVSKSTPSAGKKLTFLEQLVGNVGRFNNSKGGSSAVGKAGGGSSPY